jgi:E3 ubiquitin-protein ligase HOS1
MASAALHALAAIAPKELTRSGDLGISRLHELVIQCQAGGLAAPVDTSNEVAMLHALFDVALQNGLGTLVYDYVEEVAADKYCTSR